MICSFCEEYSKAAEYMGHLTNSSFCVFGGPRCLNRFHLRGCLVDGRMHKDQ